MVHRSVYRVFFTATILLLSSSVLSAEKFSLERAVELGLSSNYGIKSARLRVEAKDKSIQSAQSRYYPNINFDISYSYIDREIILDLDPIRSAMIEIQSGNQVGFSNLESLMKTGQSLSPEMQATVKQGAIDKLNSALPHFRETVKERAFPKGQLTFNQAIFTGGKISSAVRASEALYDLENFKLTQEQNETILSVIESYLAVVLSQENVVLRNEVLKGVENHHYRAQKLLEKGLIAPHDKMRADVALSEAKRNLFEAEQLLIIARTALESYVGTIEIDEQYDKLSASDNEESLEHFITLAKQNSPLLNQLSAAHRASEEKSNVEFASYMPTVYGFGMYDIFDHYRSTIDPKWAVGIGASFTVFNGLKRTNDYQSAQIVADALEMSKRETERKIILAVNKLYMESQLAKNQYIMLSESLAQAEENLRLNEKRYESGLGTSLETIDAQLSLEAVKLKRLQSIKEYYSALSKLHNLCGNSIEFVNIWKNNQEK